ncbi:MAG: hypothetical protein ACK55I_50980, partial [bacterium]
MRDSMAELLFKEGDTIARWRDLHVVADAVEDLLGFGVGRNPQQLELQLRDDAQAYIPDLGLPDDDADDEALAVILAKMTNAIEDGFNPDDQANALQKELDEYDYSFMYKTEHKPTPENI